MGVFSLGMFAQIKRVLLLIADVISSMISTCLQVTGSTYSENCESWFLLRTQIIAESRQLTAAHGSKKWHFQPHTPGFCMEKNRLINILKNGNSENHTFLK